MCTLQIDPTVLGLERANDVLRAARALKTALPPPAIVFVGMRGRPRPWIHDDPDPTEHLKATITVAAIRCARVAHWPALFFCRRRPPIESIAIASAAIEAAAIALMAIAGGS